MIAQNVITAVLIGIVITGVIPVIGGLILMAAGKIKGSSFWAGVLAYIIAIVVYAIISGIYTFSTMDMTDLSSVTQNIPTTMVIIMSIISSVIMTVSIGICIGGCMKLRTFKGAVSCGLGFSAGYLVTAAISLVSIYFQFVQINSGAFDTMYRAAIENGMLSKDDFNLLKEQIVNVSLSEILITTINAVLSAILFTSVAIFIMRGVCSKNTFTGIAISALVMAAATLPNAIPDTNISTAVSAAISIAALVAALTMKGKIVPPQKQVAPDPFLQSVENSRQNEEK